MVGFDVLARSSAHVRLDSPMVDVAALEALRIESGAPAMGAELDGTTIAAEVGQWFVDASVSFTKGCFVGQELVARIDSRGGNVPRRLRAVVAATPMDVGDEIVIDGSVAGHITSATDSLAVGPLGLAWLKRSVEPSSEVQVRTAAGVVNATVAELPVVDDSAGADGGDGAAGAGEVAVDLPS
jgi:folate-binding protein YgfZ